MRKAQSSLEYAVVIICLVAGLLAMQVYIKRGMQGRLKTVADELGQQYSPTNTTSDMTLILSSDTEEEVSTERITDLTTGEEHTETNTTSTINAETQRQYGNETVGPLESSLF